MKIKVKPGPMDWSNKEISRFRKDRGTYVIYNAIRKKGYVGCSKEIGKRWKCERNDLRRGCHHSKKLQNAWNKYGEDAFRPYILELCNREELKSKEIMWIVKLNSQKNGYNITAGGDGVYQCMDEEARKRKVDAQKKKYNEDLLYQAVCLANLKAGREDPEVVKRRIESSTAVAAERSAKLWADPEYRERMLKVLTDNGFKGRGKNHTINPEAKAAHSERLESLWKDPEYRKAMSDLCSKTLQAYWEDPINKQRKRESAREQMLKLWQDPDYIAKMKLRKKGGRPKENNGCS